MKIHQEASPTMDKIYYALELSGAELTAYIPSKFELECKKLAKKSGLISDKLMYLSEMAKSIEDQLESKSKIGEE